MLVSTYFLGGHVDTTTPLQQPGRIRRRHSREFKAQLVAQCRGLGVSIARVAIAHGINPNLLRRWVAQANDRSLQASACDTGAENTSATACADDLPRPASGFIPIKVETSACSELRIEIVRGNVQVKVTWPLEAASQSARWLRELLR